MAKVRADHSGPHRMEFTKNKKKILQSQDTCAICGRPVDKSLRYPDPQAPTVDHIIPINKGGHPSDITNLQLAHWICNRLKSDKTGFEAVQNKKAPILQTRNWASF